jgi:hypothetical protein
MFGLAIPMLLHLLEFKRETLEVRANSIINKNNSSLLAFSLYFSSTALNKDSSAISHLLFVPLSHWTQNHANFYSHVFFSSADRNQCKIE